MEKETYDRIWNNVIVPIYTNISNNDFYMYFKKKYMDDSEVNIDKLKGEQE